MLSLTAMAIFGARTIYAAHNLNIKTANDDFSQFEEADPLQIDFSAKDACIYGPFGNSIPLSEKTLAKLKKCLIVKTIHRENIKAGIIACDPDVNLFENNKQDNFGFWVYHQREKQLKTTFHEKFAEAPIWVKTGKETLKLSMVAGAIFEDNMDLNYGSMINWNVFKDSEGYYKRESPNGTFTPTQVGPTFAEFWKIGTILNLILNENARETGRLFNLILNENAKVTSSVKQYLK